MQGEGDALLTKKKGIGLAVSSADCAPIFIYDKINKVIAGIHSGWKGTSQKIVKETLITLRENFNCNPHNLIVYVGPSISQKNYEVGKEFQNIFDIKYLLPQNGKFKLDVKQANYDMLVNFGIPESQIEVSNLCSFQEEYLHSYRRDGLKSGRAFGIIALK
jgi:YfiH family protein